MIDIPILAKDALREGDTKKEYRFIVYQTDGETVDFTIDNDTLVYESVKFDERMCSDTNLKFGLCEGTSLEFQAFNIPNITGRRINANVLVYYDYNVSGELENNVDITVQYTGNYRLYNDSYNTGFNIVITSVGGGVRFISVPADASQTTTEYYIDLVEGEQFHISNSDYPLQYDAGGATSTTIPMGWFTVSETSRQASTGILKITAYNKLQSTYLDASANLIINETFGDVETVLVTDIIDVLLKKYAVDTSVISTEGISTEVDTGIWNPTSYKYANLYGDRGFFSAGRIEYGFKALGRTFTTSSSTKMYVHCHWIEYSFEEYSTYDYPVRVRFTDDMDALDTEIATLINESIRQNLANPETVINAIMTHDWRPSYVPVSTPYREGWYLHAEVVYNDNTIERYGKTMFDAGLARGTFADLNQITLKNVKNVYLCYPLVISMTGTYSGGEVAVPALAFAEPTYYYSYYADAAAYASDNLTTVYGNTPCYPNGDLLTYENILNHTQCYQVLNLSSADMVEVNVKEMANVTLREIQTAVFETTCEFGQLDRVTDLFKGVTLNHNRLFPAETLYPADSLYPMSTDGDGQAERVNKSMYSKLWADEGNIRKFRNLVITYKGTEVDENDNVSEVEKEYTEVVNTDGTDDYNATNNWLFKNLVWQEEDIATYASDMASKMRDVTWFPFEMWCAGLPYVETGDEVEINMGEDTYISYVLRRTLKGIQNLQDEMINGTLDIF